MTRAMTNAMTTPPCPPKYPPNRIKTALSAPSSSAVLRVLAIRQLSHGAETRQNAGHKRCAPRQFIDEDVLMESMRAVADGTEAVKRWDAERCGKVPVRSTAG